MSISFFVEVEKYKQKRCQDADGREENPRGPPEARPEEAQRERLCAHERQAHWPCFPAVSFILILVVCKRVCVCECMRDWMWESLRRLWTFWYIGFFQFFVFMIILERLVWLPFYKFNLISLTFIETYILCTRIAFLVIIFNIYSIILLEEIKDFCFP